MPAAEWLGYTELLDPSVKDHDQRAVVTSHPGTLRRGHCGGRRASDPLATFASTLPNSTDEVCERFLRAPTVHAHCAVGLPPKNPALYSEWSDCLRKVSA